MKLALCAVVLALVYLSQTRETTDCWSCRIVEPQSCCKPCAAMTRLSSHHMRPSTTSAHTVTLQVRFMHLRTVPSPLPRLHVLHCTLPSNCKRIMCAACLWCSLYSQHVQHAQNTGITHSQGLCTVLQISRSAQLAASTRRAL